MDIVEKKKIIIELFKKNNIDVNEVNIIFCEVMNVNLSELYLIASITFCQWKKILRVAKKRLTGMPLQKIFKRAYFFDFVFYVNKNVLCPRPETELLVCEALKFCSQKTSVLDLCTGSGAIAITIKKKTNAFVVASDVSQKALNVAKKNAKKYAQQIKFVKCDMFEKITQKFDVIVSNPPYISTDECETLDVEVKDYDPIISLDGGEDGLDFYKIIAEESKAHLTENGKLFLEVGIGESDKVCELLTLNGFDCYVKKDYNNIDRIVVGELK